MEKSDWDDQAEHYAANMMRFTSLHATDLVGALYDDIKSAKTILDIGCGTGAFGVAYLGFFPQGIAGQTMIFSDLSQGMVNKAKDTMRQRMPADFKTVIKYQVEDGSILEGVEDRSIDLVVSVFGVFMIPDRTKTLQTIQRVLKEPSGVFGTTAWTTLQCKDAFKSEGFGVGFHNTLDLTLDLFMKDFSKMEHAWKHWFEPDNIHTMLVEQGGFGTAKIQRSVHSVTWSNPLKFWEMLTGSPMSKMMNGADPEVFEAAKLGLMNTVSSGNEDDPIFVWFASNIVVARGIS